MARQEETGTRISISLPPSQIEWLREQPAGISGTLRALVTEAVAMDNLRKSVKKEAPAARSTRKKGGKR